MVTKINLPIVLSFESEDHVKDFIDAAKEIIPKLKYTHIAGEQYNCVMYTRKDQAYRSIMEAASAPTTIIEKPIAGFDMPPGAMGVTGHTAANGEVVATTDTAIKWAKVDGKEVGVMDIQMVGGYWAMPTDPTPNVK